MSVSQTVGSCGQKSQQKNNKEYKLDNERVSNITNVVFSDEYKFRIQSKFLMLITESIYAKSEEVCVGKRG